MTRLKYYALVAGIAITCVVIATVFTISPLRFYEWMEIVLVVVALGAAAFGAQHLRTNRPAVEAQWTSGIIPLVLGFFLLHIGVAWVWQEFWVLSFRQNGFLLSQLLLFFGLYLMSLKTVTVGTGSRSQQKGNRAVSTLGFLLVAFAGVVMFNNTRSVVKVMHPNNIPARATVTAQPAPPVVTTVVTAPPAPAWSAVIKTPGPFTFDPDHGTISVRKSNGVVIKGIKKNGGVKIGNTNSLEFQSEETEPIPVVVTR